MQATTQTTGTALVMHEDVWVRTQVAATLGQAGYTVLAASNGASGMRLAEQHQPEMIVLGMALPELSGAAVLEQLQACAATRDIPVLVVSDRAPAGRVSLRPVAGATSHTVARGDLLPAVARPRHQPRPATGVR